MKNFYNNNKQTINTIIALILMLIGVKLPIGTDVGNTQADISGIVKDAVTPIVKEVVQEELKPVIEKQEEIIETLGNLEKQRTSEITSRAVSAYSKIFTIEDLMASPEKKISIQLGLEIPACYDLLMTIDPERTTMFYNYLFGSE